MGEAGRPGDKPTGRTVRNIDCHDVASVRTSPYRRRVIGPGVVPASLVDDLGGSPKCIRACRLDLRGSYRVFTLCKELGTAAAAREAYVEYIYDLDASQFTPPSPYPDSAMARFDGPTDI